ncbi:hypothetical protein [Achromobacter sp.]|uniref:hypothetical protein n=1 Tax=Achromobacter sp. TaxID=134375 RepID=UPI0028AE7E66|nr:hypothetical protein [Achromobacter sp.]
MWVRQGILAIATRTNKYADTQSKHNIFVVWACDVASPGQPQAKKIHPKGGFAVSFRQAGAWRAGQAVNQNW